MSTLAKERLHGSRVIASILIAVIFVAITEALIGWRSIVYPWLFVDRPMLIIAGAGLVGLSYVLRALRLYRYFRLRHEFALCLRLMLQHNLLVNVLPFRTGEFAFPVLMKRYFQASPARSVPALLWLRILDLHVLVLLMFAISGILLSAVLASIAAVLWIAALLFVYYGSHKLSAMLDERPGRISRTLRHTLLAVPAKPHDLVESWMLTLANWLLKLGIFAWIIKLFSAAEYEISLAGAFGGELTAILPIHGFAGMGTYEAGVVAAMTALGTTVNDALTGAVNLHLFLLSVALIGGLASLLIPVHGSNSLVNDMGS